MELPPSVPGARPSVRLVPERREVQVLAQRTGVHQIENWDYEFGDALRSDGQYWIDAKTKEKRLEPDEQYFGPDYMREALRRELLVAQDKVHRFASQVAGDTKRGAGTSGFFKAASPAKGIVEDVFLNLLPGRKEGAPPGFSREQLPLFHTLKLARPPNDAERDRGRLLRPLSMTPQEGERTSDVLAGEAAARTGVYASAPAPGPGVRPGAAPARRPGPPPSPAETDLARLQAGTEPYARALSQFGMASTPEAKREFDARIAAAKKKVQESMPAAAPAEGEEEEAAAGSSLEGGSLRVAPGEYVYDFLDPKVTLLRLLHDPRLNEARLKAFDMAFADGAFYFTDKAKREAAAISGRNVDWENPKDVRAYLEALREIESILNRGEGSLEWKRAPEQIGLLFLSDTLRSSIERAYDLLRHRLPHFIVEQNVPAYELMTHECVWRAFASLVVLCIQDGDIAFASRHQTRSASGKVDLRSRNLMLRFDRLFYSPIDSSHLHLGGECDGRRHPGDDDSRSRTGGGGGGGEIRTKKRRKPNPNGYVTSSQRRENRAMRHLSHPEEDVSSSDEDE